MNHEGLERPTMLRSEFASERNFESSPTWTLRLQRLLPLSSWAIQTLPPPSRWHTNCSSRYAATSTQNLGRITPPGLLLVQSVVLQHCSARLQATSSICSARLDPQTQPLGHWGCWLHWTHPLHPRPRSHPVSNPSNW